MAFIANIVFFFLVFPLLNAFPQPVSDESSFIVRRISRQARQPYNGKEESNAVSTEPPKIYEMHVNTSITHRFAHTVVTSKVRNFAKAAQETVFSIILPGEAFISKFVMSIGGKEYDAYVKKKEHARQMYDQAVASGQSAGLVQTSARDSDRFTVLVNIEPESKITFFLTYEQLLQRENNQYELIVNIHPKQPVEDLRVHVNINESQPLKFVFAPSIRSGNEINNVDGDLDPRAHIHMVDAYSAIISFSPNVERQKDLAKTLGTNEDEGLAGQFVVQYDVERTPGGGEILLNDGYFIHFFAPPDIEPLPKYVLFVLDTSLSMDGVKISQVKDAMESILLELRSIDKFHLIEFNTRIKVWNIHNGFQSVQFSSEDNTNIDLIQFPGPSDVNPYNIKDTITTVKKLNVDGLTNIEDALRVALHLVNIDKKLSSVVDSLQPMIIFLTDGQPTAGEGDPKKILARVQDLNKHQVPIFTLSFGYGADKTMLQKLSLRNDGFSRHIYEAGDASLQLQEFYKHISSPLLHNVTFKYVNDTRELSKTTFPLLFQGSELVVVGQIDKDKQFNTLPTISATSIHGPVHLQVPELKEPVSRLERLWAYKTIHQLLEDMETTDDNAEFERKALDLALRFSFVTPISSLVVVKPNATDSPIIPVASYAVHSPAVLGYAQALHRPASLNLDPRFGVHDTLMTSTTSKPISTTLVPVQALKKDLPWLNRVLKDDFITTYQGSYKLGLNETSTDNVPCPATPQNGPGLCKLLHECPEVYYFLTNVYIFQQYFCEMRGLAAVCCPNISSN
ncbi:VWA domain-containing protein [Oryctes borbonicus]|uniref:VWA domain-containing protein n=1 Tax=Oryctes borbonicus TaxID=1629725 RepID=A0A0T6B1E4_9SCAR|nr:VWA domain-containing protein [Oryctes borbonicus]